MRIFFILILFGVIYILWDETTATEAVEDISKNTTNAVEQFSDTTSRIIRAADSESAQEDTNQTPSNETRTIRTDPVAYVTAALVELREGKQKLEDSLFEQKVLITKLERQKSNDERMLAVHNKNLTLWKTAYQNEQFGTEEIPFTKKQLQQLIKETFKRKSALDGRPAKYSIFLINGEGFVLELEKAIEKLGDEILTLEMEKGMLQVLSTSDGFFEVRERVNGLLDVTDTLANYESEINLTAAFNVQEAATSETSSSFEDILNQIE